MERLLRCGIAILICVCLALPGTAGAARLPVPVAAQRADAFAAQTCKRDEHCIASGVSGCRRQRPRVVLCRIFLRRDTDAQGGYRCSRLVRLSAVRRGRHAKVTGVGDWQC